MARFVTSVGPSGDSELLDNLPDIALVGPSNSGKSSLVNALAKSRISLVSNKPGKTRTLNFYEFGKHYLVDTPGYGYALGSREKLMRILDNYFKGGRPIVGVLHVVSSRSLSTTDLEVIQYLRSRFHNYLLVVNKSDRLSNNGLRTLLEEMEKEANLDPSSILAISSKHGRNLVPLNRRIREFLS